MQAMKVVKVMLGAAAIGLLAAMAAMAEPLGIAFAYAPEQGQGMCTGADAASALACATRQCMESGAEAEDCAPVAWCFPAGWTAAVGIMHREGIHWTEYSCGWESKEAAKAAAAVRCDSQFRSYVQECSVGLFYDPQGNEVAE